MNVSNSDAKRPPRWGWLRTAVKDLAAPTVTGITGGIVVAVLLLLYGPNVAENVALRDPTCEDTRGAIPVLHGEAKLNDGTEAQPPTDQEGDPDWDLDNVADGDTQSVWVPLDAAFEENAKVKPYATFKFDESMD